MKKVDKKQGKKLLLGRETIRHLTSRELIRVGGASLPESRTTTATSTNHNETLLRARRTSR